MSAFFFVFLVVFGQAPEGQPQMTILKQFNTVEECKHAVKVLPLDEKAKEDSVGCVRIIKGDAVWREA